jgi:uncharacterized small protein (DUF1192 family)
MYENVKLFHNLSIFFSIYSCIDINTGGEMNFCCNEKYNQNIDIFLSYLDYQTSLLYNLNNKYNIFDKEGLKNYNLFNQDQMNWFNIYFNTTIIHNINNLFLIYKKSNDTIKTDIRKKVIHIKDIIENITDLVNKIFSQGIANNIDYFFEKNKDNTINITNNDNLEQNSIHNNHSISLLNQRIALLNQRIALLNRRIDPLNRGIALLNQRITLFKDEVEKLENIYYSSVDFFKTNIDKNIIDDIITPIEIKEFPIHLQDPISMENLSNNINELICMPITKIMLNRTTIVNHLEYTSIDPFTREEITIEKINEFNKLPEIIELKNKIINEINSFLLS